MKCFVLYLPKTIPPAVALIILVVLVVIPSETFVVQAQTGVVCIEDPGTPVVGPTSCHSGAPTLSGPAPNSTQVSPTQIRIGVFIENSSAFNAFDITLLADHTVLLPTSIDLSGSVLPNEVLVQLCVGGKGPPPIVSNCPPSLTADTLELAVSASFLTISPTTGLLFTAIYNITSTTTPSGINVGFFGGCTGTSVSGVCVTILNGSASPDPETIQTGTFNNATPQPWISISTSSAVAGPVFPGIVGNFSFALTPQNNWPLPGGCATNSQCQAYISWITNFPSQNVGISASSQIVNASSATTFTLTVVAPAPENLYITVFAEYHTSSVIQGKLSQETLVASVTVLLIINDFSLQIQPSGLVTLPSGHYASRTLTINSLNNFAGNVTVSTRAVSPVSGLTVTYNGSPSATVGVPAGGTTNVNMTFFSTTAAQYLLSAKGTVGAYSKNVNTLTIVVQDFTISSNYTAFLAGKSGNALVTLSSLPRNANGFSGSVGLTAATSSPSLTVSCNTPVNLGAGGSATSLCNFASSSSGVYNATITGTSTNGVLIRSTRLTVTVYQSQNQTSSFNGVTFQLQSGLVNDTRTGTIHGTIQVTATNSVTHQTLFSKSFSVNVTFPGVMRLVPPDHPLRFILYVASLNDGILCTAYPSSAPMIQCFVTYNPDIYNQGGVNILDVSAVLQAFGSTPGSPRWNPSFDFDQDGVISITDLSIVFAYFGWPFIT